MFRRSLQVFVALALLGLLATWAFAALRLGGIEATLARAQDLFQRGEYQAVVALLTETEHSPSLRDAEKRVRLYQLRYAAYSKLDNAAGALRDVERLLAEPGEPGEDLQLDHIRLLAKVGRGEVALQRARAFLEKHPGHWRGLELAGEACQTIYQDELRAAMDRLEGDVGTVANRTARSALLAYIYRPDGDPEVPQGLEALRRLYATEPRLDAGWTTFVSRLQDLRESVQQSLHWYQQSLEAGGEPVAAFHGLAMSLDQSQRTDDLLILCESYRARFTHQYVNEAGAKAAWALVRAGLDDAAIATALRWLPAGSATRLVEAGAVDHAVIDLLLARTIAAWRLRNGPELTRVVAETNVLIASSARIAEPVAARVPIAHSLAAAFAQHLRKDAKNAEASLRWAMNLLVRAPVPLGQQDLLPEAAGLRVELLRARNADQAEVVQVFQEWIRARATDVQAHLALARFHLESGKAAAALHSVEEAEQLAADDEQVLSSRIAVARELYLDSKQDGDSLLQQCIARKVAVPAEVPDPVCYLLCAEAALKARLPVIARESARLAIHRLQWAVQPRLLMAEAELLGARPEEAVRVLDLWHERAAPDGATLRLSIAARRKAGLPTGEFVAAALRECAPSDELLAELLRAAAADDPLAVAPFVEPLALRTDVGTELRILAARAMARLGRTGEAGQLLLPVAGVVATLTPALQAELAAAVAATLVATAATVDDRLLEAIAVKTVSAFGLASAIGAPALLGCATELAATHPAAAYWLCSQALGAAVPDQRTGAGFALAGRLAQQLGRFRLAEEHWTAALPFPDGRIAVEPLARLCFAQGRTERALQVYRLADATHDGALALRCDNTSRGGRLVNEARLRDAGDLLANTAIAAMGAPSLASDLVISGEPQQHALLELLTMLDTAELGPLALGRAQTIAAANPESPTAQLLLARALRHAGQAPAAAAIHEQVWQKGQSSAMSWREIALAAASPGYTLSPKVEEALGRETALGKVGDSPVTIAFGSMRAANAFAAAGNHGIADQVRTQMWMKFPDLTRPTLADAAAVAARGQPLEAWWILDRIRPTLSGPDRDVAAESMGSLADQLSKQFSEHAEGLYQTALRLIAEEGPFGRLVHFVLDRGSNFPKLRPDAAGSFQLLIGHLHLAAAGRDRGNSLGRTIDRLVDGHGVDATAEAVEKALQAHPEALALWLVRAKLLQRLQRGPEAIDDLRAVLAHGQAPQQQLELLRLAACAMTLRPADKQALEALPKVLLDDGDGRFTRGLVALRFGKPDEAVALLAEVPPAADGLHLLARAEAILQSRDKNAVARAAKVLAELARDYPSSSLARYAGSFARQLAPR